MKLNSALSKFSHYFKIFAGRLAAFFRARPLACLGVLVLAAFIFSGMIFYFYAINFETEAKPLSNLAIKKDMYERVMAKLQQREANIQKAMGEGWRDMFR